MIKKGILKRQIKKGRKKKEEEKKKTLFLVGFLINWCWQ